MPPQRIPYPWPQAGFRGEDGREGLTSPVFARGFLSELRNYHMIGEGRLLKRRGWQDYQANSNAVNGANTINRLWHYRFETDSQLVAVCNGGLFYNNSGTWTDISGTATLSTSSNATYRFTQFHDGTNAWLIGTDGINTPFKCIPGTIAAAPYATTAPFPTKARDITEFMGRLFVINTDAAPYQVEFSDDGSVLLWDANNTIPGGPRRSEGIGLSKHADEVLLVFFRDTIFRVEPIQRTQFDFEAGLFFTFYPVDQTRGCIATGSIVTSKLGMTYFASDEGIFRIRDPKQPAEYISEGLEELWAGLNPDRIQYIQAFERGAPWNEVVFLVSDGSSTQHNMALVYNPLIAAKFRSQGAGWSIFENGSSNMTFNCGVNFKNSTNREITLLGGYDGVVGEAWGDDNYPTSNRDGGDDSGAAVTARVKTGLLNLGYDGLKRIRDPWLEMQSTEVVSFSLRATGVGESQSVAMSQTGGSDAARLSQTFVFDQSAFASSVPGQMKFKGSARSRLFQFTLEENGDGAPHEIHRFLFPHKRQAVRLRPPR